MASRAHPEAMAPRQPGPTRTAPPQTPRGWYSQPRMRTYLLFDSTGLVYMLVGFIALRMIWSLGAGPEAWDAVRENLTHPLYLIFHALSLVAVIFVGVQFFGRFPKAQPARIGPLKPPPRPLLHALLYAAWIAFTVVFVAVLAGWIL